MSEMLLDELAAELAELPPDGDILTRLHAAGARVNLIDAQIAELEARIAVRKAARRQLLEKDLVDLMDQARAENFKVDGRKFALAEYCHASIKADAENRDEAFDWLESDGSGDIIKNVVTVAFGGDSEEQAKALADYATQRYQNAEVVRERAVPWNRLTSWLKERLRQVRDAAALGDTEGPTQPPLELLGATVGRVVKIEEPKKPRK